MAQPLILFGGTFDPVHNGHLIVARHLAEARGLDRIVLVPAATPPHKSPAEAPGKDRLRMLRLAVEGDGLFDVSDLELSRSGPSYTIDTVRALRRQASAGHVALVIGADMLEELPHWHQAGQLLDEVEVLVAPRPPWDRRMGEIFASLEARLRVDQLDRLRQAVVGAPLIEISSSDIRRRVRDGRSIRYLVPEPVSTYIETTGLYAARGSAGPGAAKGKKNRNSSGNS
jgi:nicotinate-nucleotide adenylyltransferase